MHTEGLVKKSTATGFTQLLICSKGGWNSVLLCGSTDWNRTTASYL